MEHTWRVFATFECNWFASMKKGEGPAGFIDTTPSNRDSVSNLKLAHSAASEM